MDEQEARLETFRNLSEQDKERVKREFHWCEKMGDADVVFADMSFHMTQTGRIDRRFIRSVVMGLDRIR